MATIKEIQEYTKEKFCFVAKSCWIADVKSENGVFVKPAWNRKDLNKRECPCPKNKEEQVKEALIHFNIIKK